MSQTLLTRADVPSGQSADRTVARAVAGRIALKEGRRLARHPLVWVGFLLSLLMAGNALFHLPVMHREAAELGNQAFALAVAVLFVTFLATTRAERDGTDQLVNPTPTPRVTRTLGMLGSVTAAGIVALIWAGTAVGYLYLFRDAVGTPLVADLLQPVLLVTLAGVIGVAAGSWFRHPAYLVLVVGALGIGQSLLATTRGPLHTLPLALPGDVMTPPEFMVRPIGWHLVYLAGLTAVFSVAAVMRSGINPRRLTAAAVALCLTVAGIGTQFAAKPSLDQLSQLMAAVHDPELACVDRNPTTTCTLPRFPALGAVWNEPFATVQSHAPDEAAPIGDLTIQQQLDDFHVYATVQRWYGDEDSAAFQRAHQPQQAVWDPVVNEVTRGAPPGTAATEMIRLDTRWNDEQELGMAILAGRRLAGIPEFDSSTYRWTETDITQLRDEGMLLPADTQEPGASEPPSPGSTIEVARSCWLAGQAREPVAIWLAATASPRYEQLLRVRVTDSPIFRVTNGAARAVGYSGPEQRGITATPLTRVSKVATNLAVQLLDTPDVRDRLLAGWDHWTDPSTTTDELIATFGLTRIPTLEEFAAEHGIDPDSPQPWPSTDPFAPEFRGPTDPEGNHADLPPPVMQDVSDCTDS